MKRKNRWNTVFTILLTSFIIFCVLFGAPLLGSYSADFLFEDALGCYVSSGMFDNHTASHACMFYGLDVSDKVTAYSMPILSQFVTPYSFILAFYDLLIVWVVMIFIAFKKSSNTSENKTLFNNILYWVFLSFPFILVILVLMSPTINRYDNYQLRKTQQSSHVSNVTTYTSTNQNAHSGIRK